MQLHPILEAALQYAGRGWHVIPLYGLKHGVCTCKLGTRCESPGKHPAIKAGKAFEHASADRQQIETWFRKSGRNVGIATGCGLAVVDIDGTEGLATLQSVCSSLPRTLMATSGRGVHLYFSVDGPCPTNSGAGLDIRGDGGMVVAPPSDHHSGKQYRWIQAPLTPMPAQLLAFFQNRKGGKQAQTPRATVDKTPAYLLNLPSASVRLADRATAGMYDGPTLADLQAVARTIPNADCGWDEWNRIGMAFYASSDGSDDGLEAFCQWSEKSDKFDEDTCLSRWEHYDKSPPSEIGFGTLVYEAKAADSSFVVPSNRIEQNPLASNDINGVSVALPRAFLQSAIVFPDLDSRGRPKATCMNTRKAIEALGITCAYDVFHEKMIVGGHTIEAWAGDLSDHAVQMLRDAVYGNYQFDPGERNARDAAIQECLKHHYNPIVAYLKGLRWDGVSRIGNWVVSYLGAPNIELHREFGRLMLIAAVRRARHPGTKFDQIIVLEGPQGIGKSSAIKILAGEENFSDQHIIGMRERDQQEAAAGVWIHEPAELKGIRRADSEHIKQFARRTEDRARPAYGRFRVDKKRQCIFVATTNETDYLKEYDRAFWPIPCGAIALAELQRDRDQLWAEAAHKEYSGASLLLPERLYAEASEHIEERQEIDSWEDTILRQIGPSRDTSINDILTGSLFHLAQNEISQANQNRVARILRKLKFEKYRTSTTPRQWRYRKQ